MLRKEEEESNGKHGIWMKKQSKPTEEMQTEREKKEKEIKIKKVKKKRKEEEQEENMGNSKYK